MTLTNDTKKLIEKSIRETLVVTNLPSLSFLWSNMKSKLDKKDNDDFEKHIASFRL